MACCVWGLAAWGDQTNSGRVIRGRPGRITGRQGTGRNCDGIGTQPDSPYKGPACQASIRTVRRTTQRLILAILSSLSVTLLPHLLNLEYDRIVCRFAVWMASPGYYKATSRLHRQRSVLSIRISISLPWAVSAWLIARCTHRLPSSARRPGWHRRWLHFSTDGITDRPTRPAQLAGSTLSHWDSGVSLYIQIFDVHSPTDWFDSVWAWPNILSSAHPPLPVSRCTQPASATRFKASELSR